MHHVAAAIPASLRPEQVFLWSYMFTHPQSQCVTSCLHPNVLTLGRHSLPFPMAWCCWPPQHAQRRMSCEPSKRVHHDPRRSLGFTRTQNFDKAL